MEFKLSTKLLYYFNYMIISIIFLYYYSAYNLVLATKFDEI
jgi:hypothetical protein